MTRTNHRTRRRTLIRAGDFFHRRQACRLAYALVAVLVACVAVAVGFVLWNDIRLLVPKPPHSWRTVRSLWFADLTQVGA
ncbi:MAG TPA: hypothetical protein VIY86_09725, partial [Pirellulaceae bacterium]